MSEAFLRQRRNLIIISFVILLTFTAGGSITEINLLGLKFIFTTENTLLSQLKNLLLIIWAYLLFRYILYINDDCKLYMQINDEIKAQENIYVKKILASTFFYQRIKKEKNDERLEAVLVDNTYTIKSARTQDIIIEKKLQDMDLVDINIINKIVHYRHIIARIAIIKIYLQYLTDFWFIFWLSIGEVAYLYFPFLQNLLR
ncbi:MAG: hypothetical protein HRT41_07060 [Campylobacteraceae bacterium]|nr:hypothetical protein [Campylobacteraceae bacterium]